MLVIKRFKGVKKVKNIINNKNKAVNLYRDDLLNISYIGYSKLGQGSVKRVDKIQKVRYNKQNKSNKLLKWNNVSNKNSLRIKNTSKVKRYASVIPIRSTYLDLVHKLCSVIQKDGNKASAYNLVCNSSLLLRSVGFDNPLKTIGKAISVIIPYVETRTVKRGTKITQMPTYIKTSRRRILAINWLVDATSRRVAKQEKGYYGFASAIAQEVRAIMLDKMLPRERMKFSESMYKRNMIHKIAKVNRINIYKK